MEFLSWAVCYKTDRGEVITAVFRYLFKAEEYIEKCTPAETRDRFYIKNIDE